ncbi:MAG: class I adenylate-forming enzyme family protein [Natronomonas sp.]
MQLHDDELIAEYEEAGAWGETTLLDVFSETVAQHPNRTAIVDPPNAPELVDREPERLTYEELGAKVDTVATALLEEGIEKDDVIVVQLPNTWELALLYLAAGRAGAILSPMPVEWRAHELRHVASLTDAVAYVAMEEYNGFEYLEMGREVTDEIDAIDRLLSYEWLRETSTGEADTDALDAIDIGANDVFNLQWTSGTTADPKACPMTHNNWMSNPTPALCDMSEGDTILCAAPLVNMTALGVNYTPWILEGGTLVLHHPIDLELMVEQIQDEGVDFTILVPALLNMLLKHPNVESFDLGHVDTITTGSAAPAEWAIKEFKDRWDIEIINIWGQNEGTATVSGPKTTALDRRSTDFPQLRQDLDWDIDHTPTQCIDVKIVDPDTGERVEDEVGEVGELAFRGPGLMAEYYNQPELTADAFDDEGYFFTGDLFRTESDGFMSFFDRKKDVIIRGGYTISAKEVENHALDNDAIVDAAVVGMPDPDLGERVCLYAVPKPGEEPTLEDITSEMEGEVAVYKRPERLELVEEIPRNPVGKVLKTNLRSDLEENVDE